MTGLYLTLFNLVGLPIFGYAIYIRDYSAYHWLTFLGLTLVFYSMLKIESEKDDKQACENVTDISSR